MQAQDVACQLNNHADKHLMLLASCMMEYQSFIKDLNDHICLVGEKNRQLERELKRTTLQSQSKNEAKAILGDVKKPTKKIGTL